MQTLEKRSSESVRFDIDCSILLATGETINSVTSSSASPTTSPALVIGTPTINPSPVVYVDQFGSSRTAPARTVVQAQISGGAIAASAQVQEYVLRFVMVTTINPALEATVRLRLNDTPTH